MRALDYVQCYNKVYKISVHASQRAVASNHIGCVCNWISIHTLCKSQHEFELWGKVKREKVSNISNVSFFVVSICCCLSLEIPKSVQSIGSESKMAGFGCYKPDGCLCLCIARNVIWLIIASKHPHSFLYIWYRVISQWQSASSLRLHAMGLCILNFNPYFSPSSQSSPFLPFASAQSKQ